jgi:hypothetical protein
MHISKSAYQQEAAHKSFAVLHSFDRLSILDSNLAR